MPAAVTDDLGFLLSEEEAGMVLQLLDADGGGTVRVTISLSCSVLLVLVLFIFKNSQASCARRLICLNFDSGIRRTRIASSPASILIRSGEQTADNQVDSAINASMLTRLTMHSPRLSRIACGQVKSAIYYFRQYDKDMSGQLDSDEFVGMCQAMGWGDTGMRLGTDCSLLTISLFVPHEMCKFHVSDVGETLKILDANGDGVVDFGEFLAWYTDAGMVKKLLELYDADGSGGLNLKEFGNV